MVELPSASMARDRLTVLRRDATMNHRGGTFRDPGRKAVVMPQCWRVLVVGLVLGLWGTAGEAFAQGGRAAVSRKAASAGQPTEGVADVLEMVDAVDRELVRLGVRKEHIPAARQPRLHVAVSPMTLMTVWGNRSPDGQRVFAAQVRMANLSPEAVTIRRDEIRLTADGQTLKFGESGSELHQGIQFGNQHRGASELRTPEMLTVPAGQARSMWVALAGVPQTAETPSLRLHLQAGDKPLEIDINEFARGLLRLTVETIGPRQALGLMTIDGRLDPVSVGALVAAMDRLAQAKVARVVVRWTDKAPQVDPYVLGWLYQSANRAGRESPPENNQFQFPLIPISIRELHLAHVPKGSTSFYYGGPSGTRVHDDAAAAVGAALASALRTLPADELLRQIETGHPMVRAAALRAGGRLGVEHLPVLLRYAEGSDATLRSAAVEALGQYGEPAAIAQLVALAGADDKPLAAAAVESLAASRFAAAHQALHRWLQENPTRVTQDVVQALARHPRPLWADTIYGFAQNLDSPVSPDALRALVLIGHPQLMDLLRRALCDGNDTVRREAFRVLAQRDDAESEELALDEALRQLRQGAAVEGELQDLLSRTRDPRAVTLLRERLEKPRAKNSGDRAQVIYLLAQIGDQRVAETLVTHYKELSRGEQAAALNALSQLQSPHFRRLAGKALWSSDDPLINTAAQGLANDGSDEAVRLLIDAFEDEKNERAWDDTAQALGQLGTPEARQALLRAWDSSNSSKRQYAGMYLQNLRNRSPAFQYVMQGIESIREGELERAEKQFAFAKKMDADLCDSYAHVGSLRLGADKRDEARREFEKALQLDPYCLQAVAGMAMLTILDGRIDEGIRRIERLREKFKTINAPQFAYRAASVYGLAMRQAAQGRPTADRDETVAAYRKKAVGEFQTAFKQNPYDPEYIRHDPDMRSLHGLPEFRQLVGGEDEPSAPPAPGPLPAPAAPRPIGQ